VSFIDGVPWAALVIAGVVAAAPRVAPDLARVLLNDFKFSANDVAELERGKLVKRGLAAVVPGEIAVVGALRVNATKEKFLDRFRDIVQFKRGADVLQIGRFSDPPTIQDLAALTVDKVDFDGRTCRVRDCGVRLPARTIQRFQREIDWKAPDADHRAAALFKQVLFDNVRAYLAGGADRITQYDDDKRPIRPVDDFAELLKNSPYVGTLVPGLPAHLAAFPSSPLAGAEDFLYWSKEKVGLSPFITVTHVTIARAAPGSYVIATKDVYSSRYFDSSLGLTIASDDAETPGAFYLVYANRSRASALKGALGGLKRAIVERRAKSSLDESLRDVKLRVEKRP
jgi:hypothetical protein